MTVDGTAHVLARLEEARLLAILRREDIGSEVLALVNQLYEAGVRAVEITQDQADSLAALRRLTAEAPSDLLIGAGTVMSTDRFDDVMAAGAQFAVCPHLDTGLVGRGRSHGRPVVPGVTTATEIVAARAAGAGILKLFPAGPLGMGYLKALRGPFPDVAFLPTGGIELDDVPAWLDAGAACVGVGTGLFDGDTANPRLAGVLERVL